MDTNRSVPCFWTLGRIKSFWRRSNRNILWNSCYTGLYLYVYISVLVVNVCVAFVLRLVTTKIPLQIG